VARIRAANPELMEAQAFAKVYTDPADAELAKRAVGGSTRWK
jgi:hypothetical protein